MTIFSLISLLEKVEKKNIVIKKNVIICVVLLAASATEGLLASSVYTEDFSIVPSSAMVFQLQICLRVARHDRQPWSPNYVKA